MLVHTVKFVLGQQVTSASYLDLAQLNGPDCHLQAPPTKQPLAHIAEGRLHSPQGLLLGGAPAIRNKLLQGNTKGFCQSPTYALPTSACWAACACQLLPVVCTHKQQHGGILTVGRAVICPPKPAGYTLLVCAYKCTRSFQVAASASRAVASLCRCIWRAALC